MTSRASDPFPPLAKGGVGGVMREPWKAKTVLLASREGCERTERERAWEDLVTGRAGTPPPTPPTPKGGKRAQRNRDESAACARPTFHQPSPCLPALRPGGLHPTGGIVSRRSSRQSYCIRTAVQRYSVYRVHWIPLLTSGEGSPYTTYRSLQTSAIIIIVDKVNPRWRRPSWLARKR